MNLKDEYAFITKQIEEIRKIRMELEKEIDDMEVLLQAQTIIEGCKNE